MYRRLVTGFCAGVALIATLGACTLTTPTSLGLAVVTDSRQPVTVTSVDVSTKRGEACGTNVLGLYAEGDFSVEAARLAGGITQVTSVDTSIYQVLGVYAKVCTIVHGN